jgi:predicted GH43/DUF377 family glycosyl hydrolase
MLGLVYLTGIPVFAEDSGQSTLPTVTVNRSVADGIGNQPGVMRRDPSDIIRVDDQYYVWYSKGKIASGYDATIWYATSPDGHTWTEQGQALAKGTTKAWDSASVFTPNVMIAEERYWLFYTGTSRPFSKSFHPDSKIGVAVSDSPNGPWQRVSGEPVLANSSDERDFDSHLVDDACLIVRGGKYWMYYKGRQLGKSPRETKMGVAVADHPAGPYGKHPSNPVVPGNHEVLIWPEGEGVAALIGTVGPESITRSIVYADDGIHFKKVARVENVPTAGGAYRPEAFTGSSKGQRIRWGVHIGKQAGSLPFIERFDLVVDEPTHPTQESSMTTFRDDLNFLRQHTDIVLLQHDDAAVAVAPAFQGRVMTSTFDRQTGPSLGWINRPVIQAGLLSDADRKGKLEEHIYIFGGEERFWLGPEGGQFALFFEPGDPFDFDNWYTPPAIDTLPFELVSKTQRSASFTTKCTLQNYHGTELQMEIQRSIRLLDSATLAGIAGVDTLPDGIRAMGYQTDNRLTNDGSFAWTKATGMPSIWILGMYNPSPRTTVIIPYKMGTDETLGPVVNDSYFGKVPENHLKADDGVIYFRGDGTRRGKIGITPGRSRAIAGSYDAAGRVLTVVTYNRQPAPAGFVNSMWEIQAEPFVGDVINAYNDGSPAPGEPPLGPFYELETSSPAAALGPGETMRHVQRTMHFQGEESDLNVISEKLFGVSVEEIQTQFASE